MKNIVTRVLGCTTIAATLGLALAASVQADVPSTVDVYTGVATSAGVHAVYYTATLSSLSTGALDNRYPLANIYQDIAPSSNARASTEDGGPFAATLYAIGKSPQQFPYAVAQYPQTPQAPADSTCDPSQKDVAQQCNGGTASAHARELTAYADGVYSGNPGSAGAPSFDNATAHTDSIVNPNGSLVVTTHSHVGTASFAGGALMVKNTDVVTKVVSANGVGTPTATVAPGTVTFQGQPVQVTDQGVTVQDKNVPVGGVATGNGVSAFTFKIFTVSPEVSKQGAHASIFATGLHIVVTQDSVAGNQAVPPNGIEYILGEGMSDGFAIPAAPPAAVTSDLSAFPGGNDVGYVGQPSADLGTTTTTYPAGGTVNTPSNLVTRTAPLRKAPAKLLRPSVALASISRPNLAVMFFAWEVLIMATAASLVWRRRLRIAERDAE